MTPNCWCGASAKLSEVFPQTKEQFERDLDNYTCKNGHEFEAPVPVKSENGYAVRADM